MTNAPVGHDEDRRDLQDLGPDLVQHVDDVHGGILPVRPPSLRRAFGAVAGCPLVVAPRPGFQPARSVSAGSPSLVAGRR